MPRPKYESDTPYVSEGFKNYCFNIEHPSHTRSDQNANLIPETLPKLVDDLFSLTAKSLKKSGFSSTEIEEYTSCLAKGHIPHNLPTINHFNEFLKLTLLECQK